MCLFDPELGHFGHERFRDNRPFILLKNMRSGVQNILKGRWIIDVNSAAFDATIVHLKYFDFKAALLKRINDLAYVPCQVIFQSCEGQIAHRFGLSHSSEIAKYQLLRPFTRDAHRTLFPERYSAARRSDFTSSSNSLTFEPSSRAMSS